MSTNRIFVGNLPYTITEKELSPAFSKFGRIRNISVVTNRETGQSRGFGFVEYESPSEAAAAIESMHGNDLGGRKLIVNIANERQSHPSKVDRRS